MIKEKKRNKSCQKSTTLEFTFVRGEGDAGEKQRSRGSRSIQNVSICRGKKGKPINLV